MPSLVSLLPLLAGLLGESAQASEAPAPAPAPAPVAARELTLRERQRTLSRLWMFASLNYMYCDVIGLMDADNLRQYQRGDVDGLPITDGFLLGGILLMEVPMSMVFLSPALPPGASRIANVSAGLLMTTVQTASLFVGRPAPYYLASSVVEIGTTLFITAYAWRGLAPPRATPVVRVDGDRPTVGLRVAF